MRCCFVCHIYKKKLGGEGGGGVDAREAFALGRPAVEATAESMASRSVFFSDQRWRVCACGCVYVRV